MATVVPEYDSQQMPLHQLFKSFLAGPSGEAQVALIRKAYKTIPELTEELHHAGIHLVLVATGYPVGFYSREPMADLSALKEQTWRTASFWHISYLKNAGATNKRIPWGEQVSDFVTNVRQSEVQERWVKEKESEGMADVRRVFEKLRSLVQHSAKRKQ